MHTNTSLFYTLIIFAAIISIAGFIISMLLNQRQKEKERELSKAIVKHPLLINPMIISYLLMIVIGWGFIIYLLASK